MDLKILAVIIVYYIMWILAFSLGGNYLTGYTENINSSILTMGNSTLAANEQTDPGLWAAVVSFGRFFGFVALGIGLPGGLPGVIYLFVFLIQTGITIFSVGFVISSIWNG